MRAIIGRLYCGTCGGVLAVNEQPAVEGKRPTAKCVNRHCKEHGALFEAPSVELLCITAAPAVAKVAAGAKS
jgi:hypothetical protein